MIYLRIILLTIFYIWSAEGQNCVPRNLRYGIVCVCNATYCDSTPDVKVPEKGNFNWYVSSEGGLRMSFTQGKFSDGSHGSSESNENSFENSTNSNGTEITVNREKSYQPIYGFGGAFTDSAGINIKSLSAKTQEMLLQSYFGKEGSRYTFGRVPMGSCDFSTHFYTYADVENDTNLSHFKLAEEDIKYKIPFMRRAQQLSPELKFLAAAWSPPEWMKTNNKPYGPGVLKKEYYRTFAEYIMKFLREYKSRGVEIWGVSTGNEPTNAFIPFFKVPSMGWEASDLGDWVANDLGPAIVNSELNETYILVFDDQRYLLSWYSDIVFSNKKAFDVIDGIAVHWYFDTIIPPPILDSSHERYPSKFLIMTEASSGYKLTDHPKVKLGYWKYGEQYILDIIQNLRHWVTGWIDWNLALDKKGGPNWVNNNVDASVIVNPENDEFFKQPMYYAIKHFSRFLERYSIRIDSSENDYVKTVAFKKPSNTIVVVLYNSSPDDSNVIIRDSESGTIKINLPPYSIHTLEYR